MAEKGTATAAEEAGKMAAEGAQAGQAAEAAAGTATEASQAGEQTVTEGAAGGEQKEAAPGKAKTDPGVQKKIDKEVAKRKRAEEEREYWRGVAEGRGGAPAAEAPNAAKPAGDGVQDAVVRIIGPEPDPGNFTSNAEYTKAVAAYEVKKDRAATQIREHQKQVDDQMQSMVNKGLDKYQDDFTEKLETLRDEVGRIPQHVVEAIAGEEFEADLLYHLGSNPDEARRLFSLPPIQAAKEVARMAGRFQEEPPTKKITTAPEPVRPLGGAKAPVDLSAAKATTTEEFVARRNAFDRKQKAAGRR